MPPHASACLRAGISVLVVPSSAFGIGVRQRWYGPRPCVWWSAGMFRWLGVQERSRRCGVWLTVLWHKPEQGGVLVRGGAEDYSSLSSTWLLRFQL